MVHLGYARVQARAERPRPVPNWWRVAGKRTVVRHPQGRTPDPLREQDGRAASCAESIDDRQVRGQQGVMMISSAY